ncbi:NUDIX domain-containing protein [Actinocrispum wychmicini]|uniref:ADP-ribose pyrophosphatase YjhB (NUDIX family) n=1 Tax=Actinocrispum wychmicini TaxID=1213861 RepID=A0A4R2IG40_9PSEU|nr:NUDIX domain-containing protein [Actinocrispum wychmicini]TCO43751.1 ADP-ribose pyrophosphatase YjhB (NUDIX family) [Actinocrispum wychmicini]
MQHSDGRAEAVPRVGVYAMIGQEDRILLKTHQAHLDTLPGGPVPAEETVQEALRRIVRDQLDSIVVALDFYIAVEHWATEPGGAPKYQIAFLFDITLADPPTNPPSPYRWADDHDLTTLRPAAVRDALIAGTHSTEHAWQPWTPQKSAAY